MVFKSKMKWVGLLGLVLSAISLFVHFLLARFTEEGVSGYHSSITIFPRRTIGESLNFSKTSPMYRRLWGPVRHLESLHPNANPRGHYADPGSDTSGFIFVRIQGGFHEIRNSICDVVVVARFLNATLVIPEIQSTTSSKGISSQFKSFAYLYNEDQFMAALSKDVKVVKTLPKNLKGLRRKKNIPVFKVPYSASPYYYKHLVLPILKKHLVVELVVSDGGCLQAILPPDLEECQRLRCRVAFHALRFRQEVQELAIKILHRLRAPGQPFIAFDPGMTREALAYHGCAELFQDVHTELIQHKRHWMIKRGIVKGKLSVNSAEQRVNGSCPLMPEEIGIVLHAYGYLWDTIIYVSGGEIFGGQRTLIPLRAMFENVVDRTSLSMPWELSRIYGREANLVDRNSGSPPMVEEEMKIEAWKTAGPRPRPLPPPPARPKSYNIEGWWGWVAESDNEPDSTVMELRTNAHKLLWEAIDYVICVEADVFIPGFDLDGKGHPNFASLVMGHRLYQSAASKTYRPDRSSPSSQPNFQTNRVIARVTCAISSGSEVSRSCVALLRLATPHAFAARNVQLAKQRAASGDSKLPRSDAREGLPFKTLLWTYVCTQLISRRKEITKLLEEISDHLYHANHTWLMSVRKNLRKRLVDGLIEASARSKPLSFISHPVPECSCLRHDPAGKSINATTSAHASTSTSHSQVLAALGVVHYCPAWMENDLILQSKDKENEETLDEDDSTSSGLFFRKNNGYHEGGNGDLSNKEDTQLEDQEELEGGER